MYGFRDDSEERATYGQCEATCGASSVCTAPRTLLKIDLEWFMLEGR